ncbi:MAG: trigger factor [Actinomycetota bacterium]
MNSSLTTTSERLEDNKAKLRVEIPEASLKPALDAAYRRWANDIKVPGFRKGKVPRQLIDSRVGAEAVREEALREALPDFYVEAMGAEELEAIAPPDIQVVTFETGEPIVFEATVDLRPQITIPDLASVSVEAPSAEVSDDELDEQLDRLRDRFAELETIGREARRGDYVVIDLKGYRGEELVEGMSSPELLYEVGSQQGPPKLDGEVEGTRPGAILKFTDSVPRPVAPDDAAADPPQEQEDISFTVLVKEVKAKKLPPLDDEFAKTVGEFDSLDALKDDLRERLGDYQRQVVEQQVRNLVLERLIEASDLQPPERLVTDELEHRMSHVEEDLAGAGITLAQYAEQTGSTELEMRAEMRTQAELSVKAELLLEEVVRTQDIKIDDEDLGREIAYLAAQTETEPGELAKQLASSGRLRGVVADIMRRKALDYVVENANVTGLDSILDSIKEEPSGDEDTEQGQGES